ncbi:hypothetical protein KC722_01830 [Candidatus Kaiserbacteria bacterium]|nr:hypothetical protein [Candidatus Kaiserbacteria bacterium]MCB9811469.1 hypothetical protein [Candidatus Nomurabacteria bacterium]
MKRFSEQLKKKAETVKLSAIERSELRDRVVSYMEYHPLAADVRREAPKKDISTLKTAPFAMVRIDMVQVSKFVGAFATLILIAVPLMAERSVPGDVLYPVKVQFNEEVRSSLSFSPYAKVEWETKRLERRIAEARLLASEGKLTPEVEAEVAEAVKSHSDAAQREIATLRESDNDEATIAEIAFASALEVQSEVLENDIEKDATATTTTGGRSVLAIAGAVDEVRKSAVAQSGEGVSYEKLMARLELETTSAYEYFNSIEDIASAEERADVERRLQDIERKLEEARELKANDQPATNVLAVALADTRKLISFMTNIDVRENVAIDELVPVTLTFDERATVIEKQVEEAEKIESMVSDIFPELRVDVAAKAAVGLEELRTNIALATTSLSERNIIAAEAAGTEAQNYAHDLAILVKLDLGTPDTPTEPSEEGTDSENGDEYTDNATSTDDRATSTEGRASSTESSAGSSASAEASVELEAGISIQNPLR